MDDGINELGGEPTEACLRWYEKVGVSSETLLRKWMNMQVLLQSDKGRDRPKL